VICRVAPLRYRCRPVRLARMRRFGTRKVGTLESGRVWSHRAGGRSVRYIHHDSNGRTRRANVYRLIALRE